MDRSRIFWIGDACAQTGFARVTHSVAGRLLEREWDVSCMGVNYRGDPHPYPYPIYPASLVGHNSDGHYLGSDPYGFGRIKDLLNEVEPDVIVINADVWNVVKYLDRIPVEYPIIAYVPVDFPNIKPEYACKLNRVQLVMYTEFGRQEFIKAGFSGDIKVIPHGFDTANFRPVDRAEARRRVLPLPMHKMGAFIVGNVNRNQPRKRLDLTIQYFALWVAQKEIDNTYLLLHCNENDIGWDIIQLAEYYGIADRVIITETRIDERTLCQVYNCLDVQVSTSSGEGFGLTNIEGAACGVPQLLPDWAGIGDVFKGSAYLVPVTSTYVNTGGSNGIGGVVDREMFIEGLNTLYMHSNMRMNLSGTAINLAHATRFDWDNITDKFEEILAGMTVNKRKVA